jgi:hypothetical protein
VPLVFQDIGQQIGDARFIVYYQNHDRLPAQVADHRLLGVRAT